MFELKTYTGVIQKALIIEGENEWLGKEKDSLKRKADTQGEGQSTGNFQNHWRKRPEFQRNRNFGFKKPIMGNVRKVNLPLKVNQPRTLRSAVVECKICGKKHAGECRKASITCFKCNQKGHYANECPGAQLKMTCYKCGKLGHMAKDCNMTAPVNKVLRIGAAPATAQPKARTFNMTMRNAVKDSDVVAGTLPINSIQAKVLIDSGATKSFISNDFAVKLQCGSELLKEALSIEIANQDKVIVNQVCPQCEINIVGHLLYADLIPFKLGEFDVILGMDWLTEYNAIIDCQNKKVRLRMPDKKVVIFKGQKQAKKFLTMMQTKRLLRQGCEAYLAYVKDMNKEVPALEEIAVVNEFPDVFPDELPGLPPDREIEFAINLAPGTEPVSKAPYRMAPVEMKELV